MTRVNNAFAKLVSVVASAALVVGLMPLPTAAFADDGAPDADSRNTATPLTVGTIATGETPLTIGAQSTEDVIQVNTWEGLQDAIDQASDGKVIQLGGNIYCSRSWEWERIKVDGKNITIDLNGHTLDRGLVHQVKNGHVIEVFSGSTLAIIDSSPGRTGVITNGHSDAGGGIYVNENATLIMKGGTITGNVAGKRGGGIYVEQNGNLMIEGGVITGNKASGVAGGGIYTLGNLTMTGGRLEGNTAGQSGGGIFAGAQSSISLENVVIAGNQAGGGGGGIDVRSQTNSTITKCEITGNRADGKGGGIQIDSENRTLTITGVRTKIDGNTSGDDGGGIYMYHGTVVMNGGSISENQAANDSGGVKVNGDDAVFRASHVAIEKNKALSKEGGGIKNWGTAVLTSCTVKENSAKLEGGGIYNGSYDGSPGELTLEGCTVSGNTTDRDGGGVYSSVNLTISDSDAANASFTGNSAAGKGGGIYIDKDAGSTRIRGCIIVTDNAASSGKDVYLGKGRKLTLTSDITHTNIGRIDMEQIGVFTENYGVQHPADEPGTFFGTGAMSIPVVWTEDHTEAQVKSNWTDLQAKIADAEAHPNDPTKNPVVLQNDYIASSADVKLKVNGTVTIDLNGHTVNRNLQERVKDGHVIEVFEGATLTVKDGSSLQAGKITGGWPDRGGGIYVNENASLVIEGGSIAGNHSEKAGGGVYVLGSLTMTGGRIENNTAGESGGGIFAGAQSSIDLKNVVITSNTAGDNGGGINVKSQVGSSVENCEISDNHAKGNGGGVHIDAAEKTLTISGARTKIDGNRADDDGGGIYISHGTIAMNKGSVSGNLAINDSGGVKVNGDDAVFNAEGVTINSNQAQTKEGGGIKNWGTATLKSCSINENSAELEGGGIYNGSYDGSPGKLALTNCTIAGNTSDSGGGVFQANKLTLTGGSISGNSARTGGGLCVNSDAGDTDLEGSAVVQGNTADEGGSDVFLSSGKKLTCAGAFTNETAVAVELEDGGGVFTIDYAKANGTTDPSQYFAVVKGYELFLNKDGEAEISSDWASIKSRIENAQNGDMIPLTKDYAALPSDAAICIPEGRSITVDLNGHTLNRNRKSEDSGGRVFQVDGTLTLTDSSAGKTGTVTGGWALEGGGILIGKKGILNFEGGTITGNKASGYSLATMETSRGGGIYVQGVLNMAGGIVNGNSSTSEGGGIYLESGSKLNFEAGIVTGNKADFYGGGIQVHEGAQVCIKDAPVVHSNYAGSAGDDIYLPLGTRLDVTGELSHNAQMVIAVESEDLVFGGGHVFTNGFSSFNSGKDPSLVFTSEEGYAVSLRDDEAVLEPDKYGETEYESPFIDRNNQMNINTEALTGRNWMSGISGERYLNEINMPGAHDAGMYHVQQAGEFEDFNAVIPIILPGTGAYFAQTQIMEIDQMLREGARQLDIRLSSEYKDEDTNYNWEDDGYNLWLCHGNNGFAGTYMALRSNDVNDILSFNDVLFMVKDFLRKNPTETVILNLRVERGDWGTTYDRARSILNKELYDTNPSTGEPYIYRESGSDSYFSPYTHIPQLKDCRGKFVLMPNSGGFVNRVGGFVDDSLVSGYKHMGGGDDIKQVASDHADTLISSYAEMNPGFDSMPLLTDSNGDSRISDILWYWELNCTGESALLDTYTGVGNPVMSAYYVNGRMIGDGKPFGPLSNGQYIGWVRLDAFNGNDAEAIWRTNFFDGLDYCTVTVESGLEDTNYATQVFKVLKDTQIAIPGNIYKNVGSRYLRGWKAEVSSGETMYYPGNVFKVEENVRFTAQWTEEEVPVTVLWKDGDDADDLRPESIKLNVMADGAATETITLTEARDWTGVVTENAQKIVPEWDLIDASAGGGFGQDVQGQYRYEVSHQGGTGFTVTFYHTPDTMVPAAGSVIWEDDDDAEGIRPDNVKLHLLANGTEIKPATAVAGDGWDFDFYMQPKYKDGEEIKYSVSQNGVEGYSTVVDGFSITNTHVVREKNVISVLGVAEWEDGSDARGERPEKIKVHLLANGTEIGVREVKPGSYGIWAFTFDDVPVVDADGMKIDYRIRVDDIDGYTAEVEKLSDNVFRIINTLIVDPGDKTPASLRQAPKALNTVYAGEAQILVTEGTCFGGALMYALGADGGSSPPPADFTAELPAGTDAGDYDVWYYVKGDALHTDTEPACVTATIGKRPVSITVDDASKAQGDTDPSITGAIEGLVDEGDLGEVRYVRTNDDEAPGTYAGVLTATYDENPNYDVNVAKGDFTIRAAYTLRWLDGDESVLQEKTYVEGEPAPVYDGRDPSKAATAQYTYAFTSWDGGTVEGAVTTYRPLFSETLNEYTVRFVNDDGTELQAGRVAYGETPEYTGATPEKPATARCTYTFKGWDKDIVPVTGDTTYTATYAETAKKGILTFDLAGGTIDGKARLVVEANVGDVITIPKAPVRDGYTFKYWRGSEYYPGDKYTVEGDHAFTAVWEKNANGGVGSVTKGSSPNTGDTIGGMVAVLAIATACAFSAIILAIRRRRGRMPAIANHQGKRCR